jgi:hypothetical protein
LLYLLTGSGGGEMSVSTGDDAGAIVIGGAATSRWQAPTIIVRRKSRRFRISVS